MKSISTVTSARRCPSRSRCPSVPKIRPKPCPFCFGEPYFYKTMNGLIRHVQYNHIHDKSLKLLYPDFSGRVRNVRIDTQKGQKYISVEGWEEVETFLLDYVKDFKNPSVKVSELWKHVF